MDSVLNASHRAGALAAMASGGVDVLVVGGGLTGAGVAVDAATRGLTTALVESQDWAAGASSASSRLVFGWPRTPPLDPRAGVAAAAPAGLRGSERAEIAASVASIWIHRTGAAPESNHIINHFLFSFPSAGKRGVRYQTTRRAGERFRAY